MSKKQAMQDIYGRSPTTLFDLTGKTALVTGGAGLLGQEFCRTLAQAGAAVVIADLDAGAAEQTASSLRARERSLRAAAPKSRRARGLRVSALQVDVTNPDSVNHLVQETLAEFGRLDILVNSAALDPKFDPQALENRQDASSGAFETYPLELWNQALAVNLTGAFLCCQAASQPMLAQGSGTIINLSSIYGLTAPDQRLYQQPGQPPQYKPVYYTVTKTGILGLTIYLAAYFAGRNIRVNAISPGGVYNGHDESFVRAYSAKSVLGRMADKSDMNGALLFLASDASTYMTGANLVVDGGWSIW